MKFHTHWIISKKNMRRISHPISMKHRTIETQIKHDLATGKFQRWARRKRLYLVDSTFEKYKKEVLRRRR